MEHGKAKSVIIELIPSVLAFADNGNAEFAVSVRYISPALCGNLKELFAHIFSFDCAETEVKGRFLVNRGEGDELIWGFRGTNCQSGGYWHFSYDETFTRDDAEADRAADLIKCIKRALTEELGIHPEEQEKCVADIQLLDCGIIRTEGNDNRYEFEVCSFVRICLSEEYAIRDFIQNYRFAKDAELETRCLKLVKISDLDQFIGKNEKNMSPEARVLALKIKALSDLNLLVSDYESYNYINK